MRHSLPFSIMLHMQLEPAFLSLLFAFCLFCSLSGICYLRLGYSLFWDWLFSTIMLKCEWLFGSLFFQGWIYRTSVCNQLHFAQFILDILLILFWGVLVVFCFCFFSLSFCCVIKLFLHEPMIFSLPFQFSPPSDLEGDE